MKLFPQFISLVVAAGFGALLLGNHCAFALPASASDSTGSLELIATDGGGTERHLISHAGRVPQLVLNANQAVPVTLQFPTDKAGMPVAVILLDGGQLTGEQATVLPNGNVHFVFHSGTAPGLYRVPVYVGGDQYRLEFYVIDPAHPRNPRLRSHN